MRPTPKIFWFLLVLPSLFGFDFWSKEAARNLPVGGEVPVLDTGWVSLAWLHAENPDVAFSIPVPMPLILLFGFIAVGVLLHTLHALAPGARLQAIALATLCAGALGNLVDRLADGSVTDFIAVWTEHPVWAPWLIEQVGTSHWPIFNVADMAVLAGVVGYAVAQLVEPDPADPEDPTAIPQDLTSS